MGTALRVALVLCLALTHPGLALARTPAQWRRVNDRLFAPRDPDIKLLTIRAYVWGMPLIHSAELQDAYVRVGPLNRFVHSRTLASPASASGVGLNNDTVYSLAWIDLGRGPVVLTSPDFGTRYYTISMDFADTSANQSLGQRTHGGQLPPVFLHGPDYAGTLPRGMAIVPSKTRFLLVAGRILVRGPSDYPAVHALQDRIALWSWPDWRAGRRVPAAPARAELLATVDHSLAEPLAFLDRLDRILKHWTILRRDRRTVAAFRRLGIGPGASFNPAGFSATDVAEISAGYAEGQRLVRARSLELGVQHNGWTINYGGPRFGSDYLLRAGVAKDQPNVAIPEEAIYPIARVDAAGVPLSGDRSYRIRFAPGQLPPVGAFWSITAYDDKGRMIDNAEQRYSIGDRSPGLVCDPDGGLTVRISAKRPADTARENWLPIAPNQPFYLMLRLYRPNATVLHRRWFPPAIDRVE